MAQQEQAKSPLPVRPPTSGMAKPQENEDAFYPIYRFLSSLFPTLRADLKMAGMPKSPEQFIWEVVLNTILGTVLTVALLTLIFYFRQVSVLFAILLAPVLAVLLFFYFKFYPKVLAAKRRNEIDRELIFCARHMLIALNSGMPLFDAMVSVSKDYGAVSKEIYRIVEKVSFGESMSLAIREVVEENPSQYFRQIMLQILNSLAAGGDIGESLESTIDQISEEQVIKMNAYGQMLNPLVVFYMLFSIVIPSLGIVFVISILSFVGGMASGVDSTFLVLLFVMIGLVQFIFITYIESSRPAFYL